MAAGMDGRNRDAGELTLPAWSPTRLLFFRLAFCYLFLYCLDVLSFDLGGIVSHGSSPMLVQVLWDRVVPWVGQHIFHLPAFPLINGGGDYVYEYVLRPIELALALVAAGIWTALDRQRRDYRLLAAWLRVFARPLLGSVLIFYGLVKVIPLQFGSLTLHRLARPVGELTPMAMLWIFMATSPVYTILCGLVETVGGLLLLFPRMTTLGALVSAGAMTNVLVLNLLYDVNQKIRCVHYLLLALFLLAPAVPRLWNVLVMNRRVEPLVAPRLSPRRWVCAAAWLVPMLFGLFYFTVEVLRLIPAYKAHKAAAAVRSPYYGVWRVTTFAVADENKLLFTDKLNAELQLTPGQDRWLQLTFDQNNLAFIKLGGAGDDIVHWKIDPQSGSVTLTDSADPDWQCSLQLIRPTPDTLQLQGVVNGNHVTATFERSDGANYHLADPVRWMHNGNQGY